MTCGRRDRKSPLGSPARRNYAQDSIAATGCAVLWSGSTGPGGSWVGLKGVRPLSDTATTAAETVLAIHGLSKTFPGQRALIEVDFEVRAGEVHALVGQNGSGKSTLIKCLAGYHEPDHGSTARVTHHRRGKSVEEFDLGDGQAAEAAGLRFVHQDLGLVESLNAVENLALGRGYRTKFGTINWRTHRKETEDELAALGYRFDVRQPVSSLIPSQRTGLAIARALRHWEDDVEVVVLDEPTASLPGDDVDRLFETIRAVTARGVAVVYVSHHLDEIFRIADRVTVLRDGRKVTTTEVSGLDHDGLVELIVGRALAAEFSQELSGVTEGGATVLEVTNLSGGLVADVSFSVRAGQVVGIAGITGSGRESIAPLLFGAMRRDGGVVRVGETVLPPQRPDLAVGAGLGLVPADRKRVAIVPEMTVRENITLPRIGDYFKVGFFRYGAERKAADTWMHRLDVQPRHTERAVKNLSGGNQQKAVMARWLRMDPKALVLDEPTQGVDVGAKADIHRLIDKAAEDGAAVVVCSTDTEELVRLCSRVLVLSRGRIKREVSGAEVDRERIEELQLQGGSA